MLALLCGALTLSFGQAVLTVSSTPVTGVAVTVAPVDQNGQSNGVTNFTRTYAPGQVVTLSAPANFNGEVFSNWTVNGVSQTTGQTTIRVPMVNNENAVAIYTTPNVTLTVNSTNPNSGVAIKASPLDLVGLGGGTTSFKLTYANLTNVTLTAPATAGGNVFDHWLVGNTNYPQGQTAVTFQLTGPATAAAIYTAPAAVYVWSGFPMTGIVVADSPGDLANTTSVTTPAQLNYIPGTAVTLTAPPTQGLYVFQNWTLDGIDQPVGQNVLQLKAGGYDTAVVTYQQAQYSITATAGPHGAISPSGVVPVISGNNMTFTATPTAGWMVDKWTLDGAVAQAGGNTFTVRQVNGNHTLNVTFKVVIVFHPADTNRDGQMTVAEVTAYGVAWKKGTAWPNSPSPIPQSYVTNAIMLWKSGELYTNDPSKAVPDTWVPIALAPQVAHPATAAPVTSGTSNATATHQLDGTWQVNITVTPPTGTKAVTLEEQLPHGVQVIAISSGGVLDAKASVIRWGPFTDATPRVLTYRLRLQGQATVTGSASFNGSIVKTTGIRSIGGK